jgi:hypothetical protein
MDATTAKRLAAKVTSDGAPAYPLMSPSGGKLLNVRAMVSDAMPASSGGSTLLLLDLTGIAVSSSIITLDSSKHSTLELNTTPTDPPDAGANMTSLWQTDLIALRAERFFGYQRLRDLSVAIMTGIDYSNIAGSGA